MVIVEQNMNAHYLLTNVIYQATVASNGNSKLSMGITEVTQNTI